MKIGTVEIGISQINRPAPAWMKTSANTVIILTALIAIFMAPMPDTPPHVWIPIVLKNYILTVAASLGGFLKTLEKASGQTIDTETKNTEV